MKKIIVIVLSLAMVLALVGCAANQSRIQYIGADKAKSIAAEAAGFNAAAVVFTDVDLDGRNGADYYDVEFTANGVGYAYCVDAISGRIIDKWQNPLPAAADSAAQESTAAPAAPVQSVSQGDTITPEAAKKVALEHAGLSEEEVSFLEWKLDIDDGRQVYELEFYTADYTEYDYEIDAVSGAVLKYDYETRPQAVESGSLISEDEAMAIVLAQVPGANYEHICQWHLDREDGRHCYEGKIIFDGVEYEFEIDGYSGAIRGWESEHHRGNHHGWQNN